MQTKTERTDEQFAREKIIEYCQLMPTNIIYEPNAKNKDINNAPDYEIEFKNLDKSIAKINLEIITVWGMEMNPDGQSVRKRPAVDPFQGFNKVLQNKACRWIKKGERFFINCHSRLQNKESSRTSLRKLINPLSTEIRRLDLENKIPIRHIVPANDNLEDSITRYTKPLDLYYFSIEFGGEVLRFSIDKEIYKDISQASSCIEIFSVSDSPNPLFDYSFESQASANLQSSILEKEKKLSKIKGEKWLGILNMDPRLDANSYKNEYNYLITEENFSHSFTRIFVIFRYTSEVLELTSSG